MVQNQYRAFMPVHIEKSGDLVIILIENFEILSNRGREGRGGRKAKGWRKKNWGGQ